MKIHEYQEQTDWNRRVGGWINDGDVVIAPDPQERLGENTIAVSRIETDGVEDIRQLGLFWKKENAKRFAEAIAE